MGEKRLFEDEDDDENEYDSDELAFLSTSLSACYRSDRI
jgi:hypothetical protein